MMVANPKQHNTLEVELPEKLTFLVTLKSRYKVARGGRGSAKSWSFARALLTLGVSRKLRVLCAREVQLSIKQSVHKLLKDQIALMGLDKHYTVLESEIRGINGTEFSFTGLSQLTVDTIKSFEGYDICWVEEGQAVSDTSWKILIPTIRKDNSEIWVSYNPDLETDPTHQRFTTSPPGDCINVEMNWRDNPWFNEVLEKERQECLRKYPDDYPNIWEGKCRPAAEGAIYFKEIQRLEESNHICNVPYDPTLKVHVVFDLGWEDSLAVSLVQKHLSEIRIIEYMEVSQTRLDILSNELKSRRHNWGKVWLPHDGFSKSLNSGGKSTFDLLNAMGWDCVKRDEISEMTVEDGIRHTRLKFPQMYFDKEKTAQLNPQYPKDNPQIGYTELSWRLVECLKRYRRHIIRTTEAYGSPVKDAHAHGADCLRYVAVNADKMTNDDSSAIISAIRHEEMKAAHSRFGYGGRTIGRG